MNGQFFVGRRGIGSEADVMSNDLVLTEDGLAHDVCPAPRRRVQAREHAQQGGLSGAVGPDQAEELPARDLERHVAHGHQRAELHANLVGS